MQPAGPGVVGTPYDDVAYPSMIFRQCQPDRLAAIARLHGMMPPAIESARMLEVGGGDGLNAIALAAAFPGAEFVNFDIAALPIARGRAWSVAAGLANVRHEVLDILDAADALGGSFDYIVAHGVYAWVPEPVRDAVLALIARLLSPQGVAFVSYNALPGGHSRMALREMMLHEVGPIADPGERLAAARVMLRDFVDPRDHDEPIVAAMRREAEATLKQPDGLLFHDELGDIYAPQTLTAVATTAAHHGLRYLSEAGKEGLGQGFVDAASADISDAELVRRLQSEDFRKGRYFRSSLFVRQEAEITRRPRLDAIAAMWVSPGAYEIADRTLKAKDVEVDLGDEALAAGLAWIAALRPGRLPVASLFTSERHLGALLQLASEGLVELHTVPPPFSLEPPARPQASRLARAQIAMGDAQIATLDHRLIHVSDDRVRAFIGLLDGSRDVTEIEEAWRSTGWADGIPAPRALELVSGQALIA